MKPMPKNPATVQEIKEAFPAISDEVIVQSLEKELTIDEIAAAVLEELEEENTELVARKDQLAAELEELKDDTEIGKARKTKTGRPVAFATPQASRLREQWQTAIQRHRDAGLSQSAAVSAANVENSGLRQALVDESNHGTSRSRRTSNDYFSRFRR